MYENFEKISEEKKNRIIKAALKEFAIKGYEEASTNNIVKEAGISKGMIFHYFENKKNLYLYILDYCSELYFEKTKEICEKSHNSAFEKFNQLLEERTEWLKGEMYLGIIISNALLCNLPNELQAIATEKTQSLIERMKKVMLNNIDTLDFNENVDLNKVFDMFSFIFQALTMRYLKKYSFIQSELKEEQVIKELEMMNKELTCFMEIIKYGVCKQKQM
ncbi:TetR/AcrR family transcriptional regulator [Clostridium scatologenes]|uniref:Transcriptional regulator, TetR family n=1 Tax=Clostridium scatologenes TaxID=1548 RepID=A0A0E3JZY9_CLOSL|nr:TetR/AcrR family transcriptional regulator [Clostridium scatologenes]AKA68808.1 transcriptional regulator, TetR family [Clostridium scatologenes]